MVIFGMTIFIISCDEASTSSTVRMCAMDGNYATCSYDCADAGESKIASYGDSWDNCWADIDYVEENHSQTGSWSPGPNSTGGSGSAGSGSGSGSLNCDVSDIWTGASDDVQVYTVCQSACVYGGRSTSEGAQTCNILDGYSARSSCTVC